MRRHKWMAAVLAALLAGGSFGCVQTEEAGMMQVKEAEVAKANVGDVVSEEGVAVAEVEEVKAPLTEKPRIEVVFVLDTTGSMSGLIEAAKQKIWAIANTLATTKPAPEIKIGLVGYRDRGDQYVTTQVAMTDDLDAVYNKLMAFKADGGGDTPESVNQALNEAVTQVKWSKDEKTYRVIFLVGDSPPHMDYQDDVKYEESCKLAAAADITINTIQCGKRDATVPVWQDIARRADGRYFSVDQSGSAILAATPFDAELAKLSGELDKTRIYYGSKEVIAEQKDRDKVGREIYASATESALAQRAVFNASAAGDKNFGGSQELVNDVKAGSVKLEDLDAKELPEPMRKMSGEERKKFVADNLATREAIQAKIKELSRKRQTHIEEQIKLQADKGEGSLDMQLYECMKVQAAEKDIVYEGGPAL